MADLAQVLFLLVGRGGSKGLPGKNLREIGGLSLIGYKAKAALQSRYCTRLIVSALVAWSSTPHMPRDKPTFCVPKRRPDKRSSSI